MLITLTEVTGVLGDVVISLRIRAVVMFMRHNYSREIAKKGQNQEN